MTTRSAPGVNAAPSVFICEGLLSNDHAGARHVALDPNQTRRFSELGLQVIDEAGLGDVVEFHAELSEIALPRFLAEGRRFDLAFIDGNHRFDGVFVDLIYLGRLLRGGGIIFLDDYQLPSTKKAVLFFTTNLRWTLVFIPGLEEQILPGLRRAPVTGLVLEGARMLYVSMTRACVAVVLSYTPKRYWVGAMRDHDPSRYATHVAGAFGYRATGLTAEEARLITGAIEDMTPPPVAPN